MESRSQDGTLHNVTRYSPLLRDVFYYSAECIFASERMSRDKNHS